MGSVLFWCLFKLLYLEGKKRRNCALACCVATSLAEITRLFNHVHRNKKTKSWEEKIKSLWKILRCGLQFPGFSIQLVCTQHWVKISLSFFFFFFNKTWLKFTLTLTVGGQSRFVVFAWGKKTQNLCVSLRCSNEYSRLKFSTHYFNKHTHAHRNKKNRNHRGEIKSL